jgi:predicted phosphodiesterase
MQRTLTPTQRAVLRVALAALVGIAGSWLGIAIWGASDVEMGPFLVRLDSSFGPGETDIELPPFGRLSADTHTAPLKLEATLEQVRITQLTQALREGSLDQLVEVIRSEAIAGIRRHLVKVLAIGAVSALGLALFVFRRDTRSVLTATLAAIVAVGGAELMSAATFDTQAFASPTYSGSLALAVRVIPPGRAVESFDAFQEQLRRVVDGAVEAYASIQTNPVGRAGEIRVLHISDVHLAPLGYQFAKQVARGFDVDFVIDTGDTTSWGTDAESFVADVMGDFGMPIVWVRGNHDSRELQAKLEQIDNVHVLDGTAVSLDGLRIYGLGHPVPPAITRDISDEQFEEAARSMADRIVADLEALPPVDIIAVHDDRMAEQAAGLVPLVLSGHFHEYGVRVIAGTIFLRAGTTGGSAFGTFEPEEGIPLSAEVLYFEPGTPPRLIAYDVIEQSPKTGVLTVRRVLVEQEFGELTPSPEPSPTPTETPSGTTTATATPSATAG